MGDRGEVDEVFAVVVRAAVGDDGVDFGGVPVGDVDGVAAEVLVERVNGGTGGAAAADDEAGGGGEALFLGGGEC